MDAAGGSVGQGVGDAGAVADDVQAIIAALQILVHLDLHVVELDFHAVEQGVVVGGAGGHLILDAIIEMIYALDKVAPGTANEDTLLYGVEVKFYNMEVEVNEKLETRYPGLYIIGDGSGITHSLSHASASGVHVARDIVK